MMNGQITVDRNGEIISDLNSTVSSRGSLQGSLLGSKGLNSDITSRESLKGSLVGEENLSGTIGSENSLKGTLMNSGDNLNGAIDSEVPLKGTLNLSNFSGTRNYEKLRNKPSINGIELIGDMTASDLGIQEDKTFYFEQNEALDTWIIVHNLNKYPAVSVIDSSGSEVIGEVTYDSINQITITFKGAFKGKATLN